MEVHCFQDLGKIATKGPLPISTCYFLVCICWEFPFLSSRHLSVYVLVPALYSFCLHFILCTLQECRWGSRAQVLPHYLQHLHTWPLGQPAATSHRQCSLFPGLPVPWGRWAPWRKGLVFPKGLCSAEWQLTWLCFVVQILELPHKPRPRVIVCL